jgi:hypothetical protein
MLNKCFLLLQKLVVSGFVFLLIFLATIDIFQPQFVFANELRQPSSLVSLENVKSFDQKDLGNRPRG